MRNFNDDLQFVNNGCFRGSRIKEMVEHWINRAIAAEGKLNNINDITVSYHEEGPFDEKESLNRVLQIYGLSCLKEGD